MRRILVLATLVLAGCATAPQPQPGPQPQPSPVSPSHVRGDLIGMSAPELIGRLGTPALQIREGRSLKLQFRASSCILDAYLYPPASGQGVERVTYVDARLRSGASIDQARCIAALGA